MYCYNCGAKIRDDSNFCPVCGADISSNPNGGDHYYRNRENNGRPHEKELVKTFNFNSYTNAHDSLIEINQWLSCQ